MEPQTTSRILQRVDRSSREIVQRLQRLQAIGAALSSETDLGKLLSMILNESRHLLHADSGSIFIREDDVEIIPEATAADEIHKITRYLVLKVAQNDSITFPFKEMRLPFDEKTIAGHVATCGEILNIEDVYKIPESAPYSYSTSFDEVSGYRCKSMLVVPMKNQNGDILGVLQMINKKMDPRAKLSDKKKVEQGVTTFDDVDEELLLSLASQAAICIERTKLYESIENMFEGLVMSFTHSLEKRNRTTYGHCMRVAKYAVGIAKEMNKVKEGKFADVSFSLEELRELKYAALLHDIGKIAVPESILDKQNKLLDSEMHSIAYRFHYWISKLRLEKGDEAKEQVDTLLHWLEQLQKINIPKPLDEGPAQLLEEIRKGTYTDVYGTEKPILTDYEYENLAVRRGNLTKGERKYIEQHIVDTWEILKKIPWPKDLRKLPHIAATHHEKVDASGYPWGLTADKIPLGGKILALVDIYEALTAKDRPYKPAIPVGKALKILEDEVNRGKLDPDLFKLFIDQKVYDIFTDDTGFVPRPEEPSMPKKGA